MSSQDQANIKLAPPGAGLGFFIELFLRWYVNPFVAKKASWQLCEANFINVHQKILLALENIPTDKADIKILVPPQRGLEDSSRYWSTTMLVEHLLIVGSQVHTAIIRLSQEQHMSELVSTANVKPSGDGSYSELLAKLKKFAAELPSDLNAHVVNKESKEKLAHPWFGPFNSKQWYWLLGVHAAIHLQQLNEIKKGLDLK